MESDWSPDSQYSSASGVTVRTVRSCVTLRQPSAVTAAVRSGLSGSTEKHSKGKIK